MKFVVEKVKMANESNGISKRQLRLKYGANRNLIELLLDEGILTFLPNPSNPLRKKINVKSLDNLKEGEHYVVCQECNSYQGMMTFKHLKACCSLSLNEYKEKYPEAVCRSKMAIENSRKTEEEKKRQSEVLKARFQTEEGEITRKQISQAAKKLMQTSYKEKASQHLRSYNKKPEVREKRRQETLERWEEGGDLRDKVPNWHEDNKELSNKLAANARKHIKKKKSKLHINFKDYMKEKDCLVLRQNIEFIIMTLMRLIRM